MRFQRPQGPPEATGGLGQGDGHLAESLLRCRRVGVSAHRRQGGLRCRRQVDTDLPRGARAKGLGKGSEEKRRVLTLKREGFGTEKRAKGVGLRRPGHTPTVGESTLLASAPYLFQAFFFCSGGGGRQQRHDHNAQLWQVLF